jgi:hypothetical protein
MRTILPLPAIVLSASIMSTASLAQTPSEMSPETRLSKAVDNLTAACKSDLTKFCSSVSPGEGRQFFCLLAHEDKISYACDHAVYRTVNDIAWVLDKVEEIADACADDIEKVCPEAEPGGGEIAGCLKKNIKATSSACRAVLEKASAPR